MADHLRRCRLLLALVLLLILDHHTFALAGDAVLTWDPNGEGDLAGYRVYVGLLPGVYSPPIDVGRVTSWTVPNLTEGLTYYFAITAYDTDGNESGFSNEARKTIPLLNDLIAPLVSSITDSNHTMNSALITWGTDEPADTRIEYGTTAVYGLTTPLVSSLVTVHSQTLSNLLPGTLYHYRVFSRDAAGNLATSADHTFTTLSDSAAPTAPGNVTGVAPSTSQINLTWSASSDNVGVAGYRIYRNGVQVASSTLRSYLDAGLAANTAYSYTVAAYDAAGNVSAASSAVSVTTLPLMPTVSQAAASGITPTSATLSGLVNPSGATTSAWFEYGTTTAYGSSTTPVTLSAANTISANLTPLASGITYHFRLVARNAGGTTFGPNTSFNTPAAPVSPSSPIIGYTLTQEPYAWVEAPIPLTFSGDDNALSLSLPFSFPFYGQSYQQLYISTNGLITFGAANTAYVPQPVQNPIPPNAFIAPFWRDLYVGLRQISIASSGSEFVISFNGVRDLCCSTTHHFQVILRPDGTIFLQYGAIVLNVPTTFGIENQDGSAGVPVLSVTANTAFRFTPHTAQAPPPADTTPPVISGIGVGGVSSSGAILSWSTNEPADTQVEYGTTAAYGTSTAIVSTLVTSHAQSLAGLLPATLYHYRVRSRDAAGNLALSNSGSFTTAAAPDTAAPSVPAGLAATAVSSSQINLAWNPSTDNVGVSGYRIYRNGLQVGTTTVSSFSNAGLTAGTTYSYTIAAYDAAGNVSAQSAAVSVTAPASSPSTTVAISPAADTFLNVDTSVNSTGTTLNTYTWPANGIANAVLMKFNFSGIPAGAMIESATLNLSLVEADTESESTYTVTVHRMANKNPDLTRATGYSYDGVNGWTESACCFNGIPLAQSDISSAYDSKAIDKVLGRKSWNITVMVQEWLNNPLTNYGLLLNSDPTKGADRYRTFASMEHPTASLRPSLSITYRVP